MMGDINRNRGPVAIVTPTSPPINPRECSSTGKLYNYVKEHCENQKRKSLPVNLDDEPIEQVIQELLQALAENTDLFSKKRNVDFNGYLKTKVGQWKEVYQKRLIKELYNAVSHDNLDYVIHLVETECVDVNSKHPNPNETRTLLGMAVDDKRERCAPYLIDKGANCNSKSGTYGSALHSACAQGNLELVKRMIEVGKGRLDLKDDCTGCTPLHLACCNGRTSVVQYLLENGANVDEQDDFHRFSPLHLACSRVHLPIAQLLLTHNANPLVKGNAGENPFHTLCSVKVPSHLQTSQVQLAEQFLKDHPGIIKTVDSKGYTCLHKAAATGNMVLATSLIRHGISVDVKAENGETPVWSVFKGNDKLLFDDKKKIFEALLAEKADINATLDDGSTLLHYAAGIGNEEIGHFLIYHGIDVARCDAWKQTAEGLAISVGNDIFAKLICKGIGQPRILGYHPVDPQEQARIPVGNPPPGNGYRRRQSVPNGNPFPPKAPRFSGDPRLNR